MRIRLIVAAFGAAAFVVSGALAMASALNTTALPLRGTVWVVNKPLNNVAAYDAATGSIRAVVAVGQDPNSVVVAPGTNKAYVTNEASNDVTVISTMTYSAVTTIPVALRPHHIRTSRDGTRVYVSEYSTNKFVAIDTATDKVVQQYTAVDNAAALTHSMWISRDQSRIWAASEVANQITEIDPRTGTIAWATGVGNRPSEVLVAPGDRTAYLTVRGTESNVKRLDVASHALNAQVTVPNQPDTLQLSPDGRTLSVALRGSPAQLSVIDTATMTVTKTIDLAEPGTLAGHNWISANGRYEFVAFEGGRAPGVAVVDHTTNAVVATWEYPGGGRPHGIFYDDPAATQGPGVTLAPAPRHAVKVGCSAEAVGFCRGTITAVGAHGAFSLTPGQATTVRLRLPRAAAAKLAAAKKLAVRVQAVARDELGNSRTTAAMVTLRR